MKWNFINMYSTFSWMPTYIHASLKMQWIKLLEESHLGSKTQQMVANLNIIRMTITVTKHLQGRGGSEIHYYQLSGSLLEITNGNDNLLSAKGCLVKELWIFELLPQSDSTKWKNKGSYCMTRNSSLIQARVKNQWQEDS